MEGQSLQLQQKHSESTYTHRQTKALDAANRTKLYIRYRRTTKRIK
jgi:hypothetical protein